MHTYVGLVLVRKDGSVLVQHRDNNPLITEPNKWGICGGKKEPGDKSVKLAAVRELFEETGYILEASKIKVLAQDEFYVGRLKILRRFFVAKYDEVQKINCFEGQKIVFVCLEDLDKLEFCDEYHKDYLKKAGTYFERR